MAWANKRVTLSSVTTAILAPGSTNFDTGGATPYDLSHISLEVISAARSWLNPTSAGTTANSFLIPPFSVMHLEIEDDSTLFGFTSAGATVVVNIAGSKQV